MAPPSDVDATRTQTNAWILSCDVRYWDLLVDIIRWNAESGDWKKRVIVYEPDWKRTCA
jgi:hypothetical protein